MLYLIFCIAKLSSYIKSVRMTNEFIEIVKPLRNVAESCASPI